MSFAQRLLEWHARSDRRVWQQRTWQAQQICRGQAGAGVWARSKTALWRDVCWAQSVTGFNALSAEHEHVVLALRHARIPAPRHRAARMRAAPAAPLPLAPLAPPAAAVRPAAAPAPSWAQLAVYVGALVLKGACFAVALCAITPLGVVRAAIDELTRHQHWGVPIFAGIDAMRVPPLQEAINAQVRQARQQAIDDGLAAWPQNASQEPLDDDRWRVAARPAQALFARPAPVEHEQAIETLQQQANLRWATPAGDALLLALRRCAFANTVAPLLRLDVFGPALSAPVLALVIDGHPLAAQSQALAHARAQAVWQLGLLGAPPADDVAMSDAPLTLRAQTVLAPCFVEVNDDHAPMWLRVPLTIRIDARLHAPVAQRFARCEVLSVQVDIPQPAPLWITPPASPVPGVAAEAQPAPPAVAPAAAPAVATPTANANDDADAPQAQADEANEANEANEDPPEVPVPAAPWTLQAPIASPWATDDA